MKLHAVVNTDFFFIGNFLSLSFSADVDMAYSYQDLMQ